MAVTGFGADTRGRVPFALVGVLLLVASSTFSATLTMQGGGVRDRAVDETMDRAAANTASVLQAAADDAALAAARDPVTVRANTTTGRVLNETGTFRDSLRIRIYLRLRAGLRRVAVERGGVTATATLPGTPNASALRAAKRRVTVRRVADGAAFRVTVENVSLVARRDGVAVADETVTLTRRIERPVLAMHDRTREYERRLNREPLEGPGLGRRLTRRLYPVVWARGYGQYAGAPVENVLANRHVALSANGGALRLQRATFGRADPDGWVGLRRAAVETGARDLLAATPVPEPVGAAAAGSVASAATDWRGRARPNRTIRVGVNATADRAYLAYSPGNRNASLDGVLAASYTAGARLATAVEVAERGSRPAAEPPDGNWSLAGTDVEKRVSVAAGAAPEPTVPPELHRAAEFGRVVTVESVVTRRWRQGRRTTRTSASWTTTYRVGVAVVLRPPAAANVPTRPVEPVFERGGALEGPNLVGVPDRAVDRLVRRRGGRDAVARRAALADAQTEWRPVAGTRPETLRAWVLADLVTLRERVRNVSVSTRTGAVASGRANPAAELATRLRARRGALVDAPVAYDGVADRARVAAREAYLRSVIERLERRARETRRANQGYDEALAATDAPAARPAATIDLATGEPAASAVTAGPRFTPDAEPAYLTVSAVNRTPGPDGVPGESYYPLAARNTNLFAVPYGDAADTAVSGVLDRPGSVRLRVAGQALVAANRSLQRRPDAELAARRGRLRRAVDGAVGVVERRSVAVLGARTSLSLRDRYGVVAAAAERFDGSGTLALAVANGSFAAVVADEAAARRSMSPLAADRLRVALRVETRRALRSEVTWIPEPRVRETGRSLRLDGRALATEAASAAGEAAARRATTRALGGRAGAVFAGLPVAPVPGYWYATVNVWVVRVRGEYDRFVLWGDGATPATPGVGVSYVRDGDTVALDVDGDGDRERLGRSARVGFRTGTTVAVAVPTGRTGVGDRDGDADERSPGWAAVTGNESRTPTG